jgi:hypothetical protein
MLTCLTSIASFTPSSYTTKGAIEVDTNENSLFLWHGDLFLLENIPCYYSQHASKWDPSYTNASYTRIRRVDDGSIVVNVSETIGFGFVTPFVDEDHDQLWLFGSACNRCGGPPGAAPTRSPPTLQGQHCADVRKTTVWKATSPSMTAWTKGVDAGGTVATYNVVVARVRANATTQIANGLAPHKYIMILELGTRYMYNAAADGDLTQGWKAVEGEKPPKVNGGPSIRYSELDGYYYSILGGHTVDLFRTKDFQTWEQSSATFIAPSAADAQVSNFAGFNASVAVARNFTPNMEGPQNYKRWDWNSNDADVCCMTKDARYATKSYVIWGAGTQGGTPKPPLTRANHCANVVATAAMSLPELLAAQFKESMPWAS